MKNADIYSGFRYNFGLKFQTRKILKQPITFNIKIKLKNGNKMIIKYLDSNTWKVYRN